ncbi:hypothetical protein [Natrialbaceae archaeon AArc-T1-2]|uniref:hypothetical protein n=1 Tax=Natrialbaceae archaeon AArc-T1-2 TaxID=3053904 RepID=UPI00255AA5D1|nr:hypothetical protein [Natrialbaceae archaeon AArc-T1-2]WIV68022.1 hypothetical protein QQ977_04640 [Natrialbaceae archaeon AArc-T1-2]
MTTIVLLKSADKQSAVREVLGSVVGAGETIHFVRVPTVRCLGSLIQETKPMINYDVDYTISCLPDGYDVSELVGFATESDANRICIEITERTLTGKARIDDLTQSILLHETISGDFVVGDHVIILEELEYDA